MYGGERKKERMMGKIINVLSEIELRGYWEGMVLYKKNEMCVSDTDFCKNIFGKIVLGDKYKWMIIYIECYDIIWIE